MASNRMLDKALVSYRKNLLDALGVPEEKRQEVAETLDGYIDLSIEKRLRLLRQVG